jgi:hypothetical protein
MEREGAQQMRAVGIQAQWRFGEIKAQRNISNDDAMSGGGNGEGEGGN